MLKLGQRDEKMERKLDQPLLTQLMMNKNGQDEDELGTSGYYNFDKGYIKPETLAPLCGGFSGLKAGRSVEPLLRHARLCW